LKSRGGENAATRFIQCATKMVSEYQVSPVAANGAIP
jgi:hypothetical protein